MLPQYTKVPALRVPTQVPRPNAVPLPSSTPALSPGEQNWILDENNPLRRMGLHFGLLFTFIAFTKFHELLSILLHVNTYLLYMVGIPAYLCLFLSGGIQRTWKWPQSRYWVGVGFWLLAGSATSMWVVNSLEIVGTYFRTELAVLFMIAGFVVTWEECRRLMNCIAWAAVVGLLAGRIFNASLNGRLEMTDGSMADPNDYAALLIAVLPFLLLVAMRSTRMPLVRVVALLGVLVGLYTILSTGSRGGMVAVLVGIAYGLWRLKPAQKIMGIVALVAVGSILLMFLPTSTRMRLATIFADKSQATTLDQVNAIESSEARQYLLKRSISATFEHPLFGVGVQQFENYEGITARKQGLQGNWHETHNSFTQISSEGGIPAFLFFMAGFVSTVRLMSRTYRKVRGMPATPRNIEIRQTCLVVMIALLSFATCSFFLSMAYRFYLPAFTGIAIVLARVVEHELTQSAPSPLQPVSWTAPRFARIGTK